ncbi:MAG: hypothetical protein KA715_00485 [Xanthomonadaceae bacterium]|nr:hypothetical protein [Xanthomonadaceae bacterium]
MKHVLIVFGMIIGTQAQAMPSCTVTIAVTEQKPNLSILKVDSLADCLIFVSKKTNELFEKYTTSKPVKKTKVTISWTAGLTGEFDVESKGSHVFVMTPHRK